MSVCGRVQCALRRKPYAPGSHGRGQKRRREVSEYAKQLREKQIVRFLYGISEHQFRAYVTKALASHSGDVVKSVIEALETRLDNVVFRLGFAPTRRAARQLVSHGHIAVGKRRVFVPSYRVRTGEVITIIEKSRPKGAFTNLDITLKNQEVPVWLKLDPEKRTGSVATLPVAEDVVRLYDIKSIVEYYSR